MGVSVRILEPIYYGYQGKIIIYKIYQVKIVIMPLPHAKLCLKQFICFNYVLGTTTIILSL
jgi:hypothetical protein